MFYLSPLSYNIRDVFEVFGEERDPARVQSLISRGWRIRDVLEKLGTIEELNNVLMNKPETSRTSARVG